MQDSENAALWFLDRHLQDGRGKNCAFREIGGAAREVSYADLSARSDVVSGALARAGIVQEARVACLIHDQIE